MIRGIVIGAMTAIIAIMGTIAWATTPMEDKPIMNVEYPQPKNNGVLVIPAGRQGHYIWDSRFDLCFFVTRMGIVQVNCKKLDSREATSE